MLSQETEERLANILINIGEGDQDIEVVRQVLSEIRTFEPFSTFRSLDRFGNGFLTSTDLLEFLRRNNFRPTERESYLLIREWDSNSDGLLSYGDFQKWMLPSQNQNLAILASRRMGFHPNELSYEIEYALMRVLEREISYLRRVENFRQDLERMPDFNLLQCFQLVDDAKLSYLTIGSLERFLERNGYKPSREIMESIMRRIDKNGDSRVSYSEFVDSIMPSEPFSKIGLCSSTYLSGKSNYSMSPSPYKSFRSSISSDTKKTTFAEPRSQSPPRKLKSALKKDSSLSTRSSMSRESTSDYDITELAKTFGEQITLDKELENMRQELALRADFTIADAFRMLESPTSKGHISELQLDSELRSLNVYSRQNELYLLFRHYDKDCDGKLTYSDLCDMLTPRQSEYSKLLNSRAPSGVKFSRRKCALSIETQELLARVFKKIFDIENASEIIRQRIANNPSVNIHSLFLKLDKTHNGSISIDGFRKMLHENGIYPTEKDLMALLSRYDKDKDGKVSYREFVQEIEPKSPPRN
ncbi:unnamed protein product [Blepharisma stoltei]|uniref:EF-hand domain-containing protein n=1 Tax=Blepharisma stoltei TaxID=1481888 RepID=A0AAU9J6X5_9CILI|nr:unnamed protein product [Blepharisma stoltei]